jgi:hypothetical protein
MSRSIYLILPDWQGHPNAAHEAVVDVLRYGPERIQLALELWRLGNNEPRAHQIEQLLENAYEGDNPILATEEIKKFDSLLEGLDDCLRASLLDESWQIPSARMDEVRQRTSLLELDDEQGHVARDAVSEGLARVHGLRAFLQQGIDRGLHIRLS